MRVIGVSKIGTDYKYKWPTIVESFAYYIEYRAVDKDGTHTVRIGYTKREVYEKERWRVVVWIDEYPHAEFFATDDFEVSGDLMSEIRIVTNDGKEKMCRYPEPKIPSRYTQFQVEGLPNRVKAKGVHNAWCVVANLSDHKTMIALAALRKDERKRK